MPTMEIYQNNRKIESKEFRSQFYILRDLTGNICWTADSEGGGNEILIWIQSGHRALFVRPDWRLIIDGTSLPQNFYATVELAGKQVSFQYNDYEFVCKFPKTN